LSNPEEALSAGNVMLNGYEGQAINAYQATPAGPGPYPGVVVIHHLPGWDSSTKEIARTFAAHGYNAICPNLYAREGLEVDPDDAAAAARAKGGVSDEQLVGDVGASIEALRALPTANGKTYEFHNYEGAGHAFFSTNRTAFRPEAALDGWERIFAWFGQYLSVEA
jgi:carboxymethylenebutenolidase